MSEQTKNDDHAANRAMQNDNEHGKQAQCAF